MYVLYNYALKTTYCVVVWLCAQHAAIANCEHTVGDYIMYTHSAFN